MESYLTTKSNTVYLEAPSKSYITHYQSIDKRNVFVEGLDGNLCIDRLNINLLLLKNLASKRISILVLFYGI